jgi:hypothetical protein
LREKDKEITMGLGMTWMETGNNETEEGKDAKEERPEVIGQAREG